LLRPEGVEATIKRLLLTLKQLNRRRDDYFPSGTIAPVARAEIVCTPTAAATAAWEASCASITAGDSPGLCAAAATTGIARLARAGTRSAGRPVGPDGAARAAAAFGARPVCASIVTTPGRPGRAAAPAAPRPA